jgi:dihydrofolate reductase
MRRLIVFNNVTVDGYFTGAKGDFSWAHNQRPDAEWDAFVAGNAGGDGVLLFGRVTYEMMASYWPTPLAERNDPVMAGNMNRRMKLVFSRTLKKAAWSNTKLVKGDLITEVRKLKREPGPGLVILGSGSLVAQLAQAGLIDEYQFVVNPVALGKGRTMFQGLTKRLDLKLTQTRTFGNGNVLLIYEPAA